MCGNGTYGRQRKKREKNEERKKLYKSHDPRRERVRWKTRPLSQYPLSEVPPPPGGKGKKVAH